MNIPKDVDQLKFVFSSNLNRHMERRNKSASDVSADLGVPYTTVISWTRGEKYPRMDKVQALADYFNISKADLIEEQNETAPDLKAEGEKQELLNVISSLSQEEAKKLLEHAQLLLKARAAQE